MAGNHYEVLLKQYIKNNILYGGINLPPDTKIDALSNEITTNILDTNDNNIEFDKLKLRFNGYVFKRPTPNAKKTINFLFDKRKT